MTTPVSEKPVSQKKPSTAKSVLGVAARTAPALSRGPGWAAFVAARNTVKAVRARKKAEAAPAAAPAPESTPVVDVVKGTLADAAVGAKHAAVGARHAAQDAKETVKDAVLDTRVALEDAASGAKVAVSDLAEAVKGRRVPRTLIVLGVLSLAVGAGVLFRRLRAREVPPIADAPPTLVTAPNRATVATNGHAAPASTGTPPAGKPPTAGK